MLLTNQIIKSTGSTGVNKSPFTKYRKSVKPPTPTMLKPGKNNAKLGGVIKKRKWKGLPIYSLTLEERASCPTHCEQWNNCFGNNMPFAHRYDHTHPDFLPLLEAHIQTLLDKHPQGLVVRLHVLGDFYSPEYVDFWRQQLSIHPNLNAFGYTHHRATHPIGKQINLLNESLPDQWRIRFSDDMSQQFRSEVSNNDLSDEVICPEQLDKTASCATCGFCWTSEKPVVFIEH